MKDEHRQMLQEIQDRLRNTDDELYANDGVYATALMLDSVLNDDLSLEEALNEFIANSNVEIEAEIVNAKVV